MKIIDNVKERLKDDLTETIQKGSKIRIAAATFSMFAFEALKKELGKVEELRFIFNSPAFTDEKLKKEVPKFFIPHLYKEADLCGGEFEVRLKNQLNQRAIAKECAKWVKEKAVFKSNLHLDQPITNILHINNVGPSEEYAYLNVNSFTTSDLGLTQKKGYPTFIHRMDYPDSHAYLDLFDQVWEREEDLQDVTQKVQEYFETAYKENSPEYIYFISLYNIFNEFLQETSLADNLPNEQIGFKDTVVWSKLYNFQRDAVIGAINKLEKYKGCILADSVGLGKTFTALGIIKYYELRNKDVLVLCPKKLEDNWNTFRHNNKSNFLNGDKFHYEVLFHTDLSRDSGISNGRRLEDVNWGNFGLVVIDESHNFRNNNPNADRENRYQKLLRTVIKEGIETKVLMLSATPVNNKFNDLKNQLALAYEGDTTLIDSKLDSKWGIDQLFKRAQSAFRQWCKLDAGQRTGQALLEMLDFDFFGLLDALTIARSRKHITTYYDTSDIGQFSKRNKPEPVYSPLGGDSGIGYVDIAERLLTLNLSIYTPLNYLLPSKESFYAEKYQQKVRSGTAKLVQKDRDNNLRLLMRINLLKRLESSVHSFKKTVWGINDLIESAIRSINQGSGSSFEAPQLNTDNEEFDWDADWGDEEQVIGKKVKVRVADMDTLKWKEDLEQDLGILMGLYKSVENIEGAKDPKLQDLFRRLDQKITNPFNAGNKKAIVFTAFADTADYLYGHFEAHIKEKYGLNTAIITGSRKKSNTKGIPGDLNPLLSAFSPKSKEKELLYPNLKESIDILIATDCISEGQNLQDCDYLVNYDIHWNPVRIIQRFGRIDRIGSTNDSITMVNFWPDVTLDTYINLKQRVESRMFISNLASTGDDNILKLDEQDLEYRKAQLQKLKDEVIDLEDIREGVSITDLGLNDFRVDLTNYINEFGEISNVPTGLHAVVRATEMLPSGVIFVLKNVNTTVNIDKQNRLHPYYLVYIKDSGELLLNHVDPKKIMDAMRKLCKGQNRPIEDLCKALSKQTDEYHDMSSYSALLKQAIGYIVKADEEKEISSLFKAGGTTALTDKLKGVGDFNLITFLIVR